MSRSSYVYDEEGRIMDAADLKPEDREDLTKSAVVVPLKYQGRVIGAVQVLSCILSNFTEDDVRLIESLAAHATAAIAVAKHKEAEAKETRQRHIKETRLGILERAMDGLEEAVIVWRISPGAISPIGFNKEAEASALNPNTIKEMRIDDIVLDLSGLSLQDVIRKSAASKRMTPSMMVKLKMSDGGWKETEVRLCLIDDDHFVLYADL
jgi:signal transduction protein with GAF and PtsI domain